MEKLDHNFSYVYERMSNIEYDNVNFKDKLSSFMKGESQNSERELAPQKRPPRLKGGGGGQPSNIANWVQKKVLKM